MGDGGRDLWHELSGLADAFADLGRRLLHASRRLHAPGALPPTALAEELNGLRTAFEAVRAGVLERASVLSLTIPNGALDTLKEVATLLEAVGDAEQRREQWAERTVPALAVLDRVLGLSHVSEPEFAPLVACQAKARALKEAIVDSPGSDDLQVKVDELAELDHPFAYLVTMAERAEGISDDLWESLFEAVSLAFGKPLAAAAARSRIVLGDGERAPLVPVTPRVEVVAEATDHAQPHQESEPETAPELAAPMPTPVPAAPTFRPAWHIPGMAEPELPISPTVSVRWETEHTTFAPMGLDGPVPLSPNELSDEVLTRISTESIAFIPRSIAQMMSMRRIGRPLKKRTAPKVEALETVQLLSGCAAISGYVYLDTNNNGVFNSNESGIANDPIELLNSSGVVVGTTTTDATGAYSFMTDSTISQATQTVTQTASVPTQPTDFSTNLSLPQFDSSLGTLTQVDVTVSGLLSSDIKSENLSTSSPTTITATVAGMITLDSSALNLNLSAPVSAPAGTYNAAAFTGGPITYTDPSGHDFGTQTASFQNTQSLTTAAGDDLSGFIGSGSIAATFTANATSGATAGGNLQTEATSTASANVSVTYYYTPNNCLKPGNYTIEQVTQPPGTLKGHDSSSNGTIFPVNTTPNPDTIPVTLGTSNSPNNDFAELPPASVSGYVYVDQNDDGLKEAGEPGIAGIPIQLTGSNDLGSITPIDATTGADGSYDFGNLRPGTYTVTQLQQPAGYFEGLATQGNVTPIPGSNTTGVIPSINVGVGQNVPNNDFGELLPGTISGFVYQDQNDDGLKETGEPGISDVTLQLTGTDAAGTITPETTTTAADGSYSFGNLAPGTYKVTITQPNGYLPGLATQGNVTPIAGSTVTGAIPGITISYNGSSPNNDFGELLPGAVSGYVYQDANDDGLKETGEPGIAGVPVELTGTNDLGPITPIDATTGADGSYDFSNLRPGTYTVTQLQQPSGYIAGLDTRGNVVPLPNSNTTHTIPGIGISFGQTAPNNDFGELLPGTLSGYVYYDKNDDGLRENSEPGISGIPIELTGTTANGAITPETTTTGADGSYSFGQLLPGTYAVTIEQQPAGYLHGLETRGNVTPIPGSTTTNVIPGISLSLGQSAPNNNFGELLPGGLSGYVYQDTNDNGTKQANEPGIGGVPLTLTGTNDLGTITPETTTTASDGSYSFGNLRPGTYTVTETQQPKGYTPGFTTQGNISPIPDSNVTHQVPAIPVVSGQTTPNNDFGEILIVPPPGGQTTTPPPTVVVVNRLGIHEFPTSFAVTFDEPLNPTSATNLANYKLVVAFRDGRLARRDIPLKSATYNALTNTVILTPVAEHLNIHYHYQLTITGVENTQGELLAGNGTTAGTPYVTIITKQNYAAAPGGPSISELSHGWSNRYPRLAALRAAARDAKTS